MTEDTTTRLTRRSRRATPAQTEAEAAAREPVEAESGRAELTVEQVLAWADAHHEATGNWPEVGLTSGEEPVAGAPGESWKAINHALALGLRGLPGDSSLAELLAEHRGTSMPDLQPGALADKIWAWEQEHFPIKRPRSRLTRRARRPVLRIPEILAWAEAHHAATGKWPTARSGRVCEAPIEVTWSAIHSALERGLRGLPGGTSLPQLLIEHGRVEPRHPLTPERIVAWAEAHHEATGSWPTLNSGKVLGTKSENWSAIDQALTNGSRGLPGGSTLSRLLTERLGLGDKRHREPLAPEQIVAWAEAHHAATGALPTRDSGPIVGGPPGLTWCAVCAALSMGGRGLPGGMTLIRLWSEYRVRRSPLSIEQILAWADVHHRTTGYWPTPHSGRVRTTHGERWNLIDDNLRTGARGLPGGSSLARLLAEHRGHGSRESGRG